MGKRKFRKELADPAKRSGYFKSDPAAGGKFPGYDRLGGGDGANEIVQDTIGDCLGKGAHVAKRVQVQLKGFAFNALFFRGVANGDRGEVGLAGHGAEGGELGGRKGDLKGAVGLGIGKGFQSSQGGVGGDSCFTTEKGERRHP